MHSPSTQARSPTDRARSSYRATGSVCGTSAAGADAALADAAEQDFVNRSKGGIPDVIPDAHIGGAPLGIAALLKAAGLAPSTSEANRLIEGGGVRIEGSVVSDKALKLDAGVHVVQVGKRKFARVHLS